MRPRSVVILGSVAVLAGASCRRAEPRTVAEVVVAPRGAVPADPGDAAWRDAPVHVAPLILQDMVEPRLMQASTPQVRVQAVTDGARVAFRLEWADATLDDLPRIGAFSDACAVQLPARVLPDVPAPQMGEGGRPVEITFWRAAWQAAVDGRGDTIRDLYPNASVDHYPFDAAALPKGSDAQREMASRYAPARALGNAMAGPREKPVEDLVAEGPGTLEPGSALASDGRGKRTKGGWSVVISRRLPAGLAPGARTQVAFAVWEGSRQEAGSRKMRTGWVPMLLEKKR
jgi:hypothetical protein